MTDRTLYCTVFALYAALLCGCAPAHFTTLTIFDTPAAFVRLEVDSVDQGKGHTHPVSLTPDQMAAVLRGITIEEPWAKLPIYDDTSQPRRHPAFSEKEVMFFAPLLAVALGKATPEEVVTFYQSRSLSGTSREITSGGLFAQGDELHIILANYHSPTHFSADIGVADTTDDRLTPMRAHAPQRGKLDFEPHAAKREATTEGFAGWFRQDRREVRVLYRLLSAGVPEPRPLP
jgi:hypothetical protein